MKRIIAFSVFLFLLCQVIFAQTATNREPKSAEERAEMATARLTKTLSLNEDQATKVKAIHLERFQKMEALKAKFKEADDKVAARGEAKTAVEEADQKLKEVLTAEQFAKYEQQKQDRMQKQREKGRDRRSGK